MPCALTSTLMSTAGIPVCCRRLAGARGFSNDKSLMYWALIMSWCWAWPGSAPLVDGAAGPLPVVSDAIGSSAAVRAAAVAGGPASMDRGGGAIAVEPLGSGDHDGGAGCPQPN